MAISSTRSAMRLSHWGYSLLCFLLANGVTTTDIKSTYQHRKFFYLTADSSNEPKEIFNQRNNAQFAKKDLDFDTSSPNRWRRSVFFPSWITAYLPEWISSNSGATNDTVPNVFPPTEPNGADYGETFGTTLKVEAEDSVETTEEDNKMDLQLADAPFVGDGIFFIGIGRTFRSSDVDSTTESSIIWMTSTDTENYISTTDSDVSTSANTIIGDIQSETTTEAAVTEESTPSDSTSEDSEQEDLWSVIWSFFKQLFSNEGDKTLPDNNKADIDDTTVTPTTNDATESQTLLIVDPETAIKYIEE